jgi:ribose 5-phosphate isomerase B
MKIAVASDHAAVAERKALVTHLEAAGHDVHDLGAEEGESVDYPDFAEKVARAVAGQRAERGVLICGTGIGICMAAGKIHGIRAATIHDPYTAEMCRRHNDANVFCMGGRIHSADAIQRMVDIALSTPFEGGRHARRVEKIMALEARADTPVAP